MAQYLLPTKIVFAEMRRNQKKDIQVICHTEEDVLNIVKDTGNSFIQFWLPVFWGNGH